MRLLLFIFFIGSMSAASAWCQADASRHLFDEKCSHTNGRKDGDYSLRYKGQLIEKGTYYSGIKKGKWQYFSFNGILEFEYDYEGQQITKIGGQTLEGKYFNQTPCFYHGSPLIPYLFMVNNVYYPSGAIENDLTGRVTLTLKINKNGEVYGYYLSEKLHWILDRAVMDAAAKIPTDWMFIPATRNGFPLMSEYSIPIEFELSH